MRMIKFRALDDQGIWHYSHMDTIEFWQGIGSGRLRNETLGQFTGLSDKERKEIWEGDIVKIWVETVDEERPIIMTFPVEFKSGEFRVGPRAGQRFMECEVIGNIYQNGDLLK